jgi:hypothetical protein
MSFVGTVALLQWQSWKLDTMPWLAASGRSWPEQRHPSGWLL